MVWTAAIVICFGKVIEITLAEEIGKRIVVGSFIIGIFEVFVYVLAPFFYHWIYDKKKSVNLRLN